MDQRYFLPPETEVKQCHNKPCLQFLALIISVFIEFIILTALVNIDVIISRDYYSDIFGVKPGR